MENNQTNNQQSVLMEARSKRLSDDIEAVIWGGPDGEVSVEIQHKFFQFLCGATLDADAPESQHVVLSRSAARRLRKLLQKPTVRELLGVTPLSEVREVVPGRVVDLGDHVVVQRGDQSIMLHGRGHAMGLSRDEAYRLLITLQTLFDGE
jgi:hypothetical protein